MKTIHAARPKSILVPNNRSYVYDLNLPSKKPMVDIDIRTITGGKSNFQICAHQSCPGRSVKVTPKHKELIRIVLPKNY